MPPQETPDPRFLTDRMLGTLCRYLRFMGYDTLSANSFRPGNHHEDTELLKAGAAQGRILLTRDRELAGRAGAAGILITSEDVLGQVRQLQQAGLIDGQVRMNRCSLCNAVLKEACECEIRSAAYAPNDWRGLRFFWCEQCRKLYWNGSHGRNLALRLSLQDKYQDR